MTHDAELKAMVKEKYSAIANQDKTQNLASCCGATSSCCGDDVYNLMADDYNALRAITPMPTWAWAAVFLRLLPK
jgi:hypothetical protein